MYVIGLGGKQRCFWHMCESVHIGELHRACLGRFSVGRLASVDVHVVIFLHLRLVDIPLQLP